MKKENSTLVKKLAQYSAMVTPALALASAANAQIVYTDVNPDFVLTDSATDGFFSIAFLDLDADGVNDFTLWALSAEQGGGGGGTFNLAGVLPYSTTVNYQNVNGNGIVGSTNSVGSYYVSALNQGAVIGTTANVWTQVSRVGTLVWTYLNGGNFGQWKNDVTDKYMGIHFLGGDGNYHFGWARMDVFQNPVQITLKDFAFETGSEISIHAGDAGNIGIPSVNNKGSINMFAFEKQVFISTSNLSGDQMTIAVIDMMGKTVLSQTTKETTVRMSLNDLANSMYLITATKGNEVKTIKVSIR